MLDQLPSFPGSTRRGAPVAVSLSLDDRRAVEALLARGQTRARIFKRAMVLRLLDQGAPPSAAVQGLGVSFQLVRRVALRYAQGGLAHALAEAPRPGRRRRLSAEQARQLLQLRAEPPPGGAPRWTIRALTDEALRRGLAARLGRETVRTLLRRLDG